MIYWSVGNVAPYYVTLLLRYIVTTLHCYYVTMLLCYYVTLLHCIKGSLQNVHYHNQPCQYPCAVGIFSRFGVWMVRARCGLGAFRGLANPAVSRSWGVLCFKFRSSRSFGSIILFFAIRFIYRHFRLTGAICSCLVCEDGQRYACTVCPFSCAPVPGLMLLRGDFCTLGNCRFHNLITQSNFLYLLPTLTIKHSLNYSYYYFITSISLFTLFLCYYVLLCKR